MILLDIDNLPFPIDNETYFIIPKSVPFIYRGEVRASQNIITVYRESDIQTLIDSKKKSHNGTNVNYSQTSKPYIYD